MRSSYILVILFAIVSNAAPQLTAMDDVLSPIIGRSPKRGPIGSPDHDPNTAERELLAKVDSLGKEADAIEEGINKLGKNLPEGPVEHLYVVYSSQQHKF